MKTILALLAFSVLASCSDPALINTTRAQPTFVLKIAWPWDPSVTYSKGDFVTMPEFTTSGPIYRSLQDGNVGIEPPSMIVDPNDAFGPVGAQLPGTVPTAGWQAWWALSGGGRHE